MIILALKTDQEEAQVSLYNDDTLLSTRQWLAHRELTVTLFQKIDELLLDTSKKLDNIGGIVCFEGPGSFTGLRIGLTTANTLAYACTIPIVAKKDDNWAEKGIAALRSGEDQKVVLPFYGSEAHITVQKR